MICSGNRETIYPDDIEHVIVYRKNNEYAGWPFNGGFWHFGNGELLVGFNRNKCSYTSPKDVRHSQIQLGNGQLVTMRSTDGGRTWPLKNLQILVESRAELRAKILFYPPDASPLPKPQPVNFSDPNVIMAVETPLGNERGPTAYFLTRDKGYTWEGPHLLYDPVFETIQARPSYVLRSDGLLLWFVQGRRWDELSDSNKVRDEGRPMILASMDGVSWNFLSYITPESTYPPKICPYPAILPDGRIVVALRSAWPDWRFQWTEIFISEDNGLTWRFLSRVNEWGTPASLVVLKDGRLLCVYGRRTPPYGIRAKISNDEGMTWGREIILRDDGGSPDLGYPRAILLPNGKIITVYYFNNDKDSVKCEGGVRYIAATIFEAPY
ncbi:exo-alpha-sialidase [Candidatus Bathyarchaeota archaeon]|nr:exo-alpha-sialidase [Candidatus Bathyarchaeota archaeon]